MDFEFRMANLILYFIFLNTENTEISVILDIRLNTVTVINFGGRMINYINIIILMRVKSFVTGGKEYLFIGFKFFAL